MRTMPITFATVRRASVLLFDLAIGAFSVAMLLADPISLGGIAVVLAITFVPALLTGSTAAVIGAHVGTVATLAIAAPGYLDEIVSGYWAMAAAGFTIGAAVGAYNLYRSVVAARTGRVVSLSGFARVGKDTAAAALVADGFKRIAFADKLKSIAYESNPVVRTNDLLMLPLASIVDEHGWDAAKAHDDVRRYLQDLGSAVRTHLGENTWVDAAFAEVTPGEDVVITDARHPNELAAVKARRGTTVRITRPGVEPVNDHISETALDEAAFDYTVYNVADVATLHATMRALVHRDAPAR